MIPLPRGRSSSIQNAPDADGHGEAKVTAKAPAQGGKPPEIALGWRVTIGVWICGFVGLFLYEAGSLLWATVRRLF